MKDLNGKKVAIITENGFEEVELTSPKKALEAAGATVHIVSPQKNKVKAWNHDHWSIEIPVDVNISNANAEDYDALVVPGGVLNPDQMRINKDCVSFAKEFLKSGNTINLLFRYSPEAEYTFRSILPPSSESASMNPPSGVPPMN